MGTARSRRRGRIAASVLAATTSCRHRLRRRRRRSRGDRPRERRVENKPVTLSVATSQNEETPNYYCGVELLKERLEEADIGFTVELYPASQLGPDADRFPLVQAGDIDIDLQGASALSATYEPIGVVDAAYAFNDVDHAFQWIDESLGGPVRGFHEATGVNIVDGWFFGTARSRRRTSRCPAPTTSAGVPIRFPNSPIFLANAESARRDQPGLGRGGGGVHRAAAGHRRGSGEPHRRDALVELRRGTQHRDPQRPPTSASTGSSSATRRTRR